MTYAFDWDTTLIFATMTQITRITIAAMTTREIGSIIYPSFPDKSLFGSRCFLRHNHHFNTLDSLDYDWLARRDNRAVDCPRHPNGVADFNFARALVVVDFRQDPDGLADIHVYIRVLRLVTLLEALDKRPGGYERRE